MVMGFVLLYHAALITTATAIDQRIQTHYN